MSFGKVLISNINKLYMCGEKKNDVNAFWIILRDIARDDILSIYPHKIDSDKAVDIYYQILSDNENKLPKYFITKLRSNNQERYRVINRNLFTSNAFHSDGLANQKNILAYKEINESKKGERIVYQGDGHDNTKK